jgi:formamidopyrimidine-DNA glycosylase
MPELPEVETMAQDLAPLVRGARISEVWWDWEPVVRDPAPSEFARRIRGRRILDVGRRAKWLVLDLTDQGRTGQV